MVLEGKASCGGEATESESEFESESESEFESVIWLVEYFEWNIERETEEGNEESSTPEGWCFSPV